MEHGMFVEKDRNDAYEAVAMENKVMTSPKPADNESGGKDSVAVDVDSFEEFTGYTTLHGLRFIGDHTSIVPRRLVWLLLVLLCGSLFGMQMYDRAVYFLESPTNVDIKVNYPNKVVFPAVTLCNQNNFRISKAYDGDWLNFITGFYGNGEDPIPSLSEERLNASIAELFVGLAHAKEDFIVKCQWANEECSAANFTTTLTSHGVCFTFNDVERPEDSLVAQASGVEHALQLTLNTEDYESLHGPHDTKGIKMMITDQSKVPRVEDIGLAISTGTHAFVGISALTLSNLPPPYGECGEVPLLSTDRYTKDACLMECETRYTYNTCGCRHFYMPDLTGAMAVCSIEQFLTCLREAKDQFNKVRPTICQCPTSCLYNIYEPTVSYATSSHMKAEVEDAVDVIAVKERYFASKEISSKTDDRLRSAFDASLSNAVSSIENLNMTLSNNIGDIEEHNSLLYNLSKETRLTIKTQENIFQMQTFIVQDILLHSRDETEEKTFKFVCQDYFGFIRDVQDKITTLVANNQDDVSVAKVIYLLLQSSLANKQDTLKRALANYRQLVDIYHDKGMNKTEISQFFNNTDLGSYDLEALVAVMPKQAFEALSTEKLYEEDIQDIINLVSNIETYAAQLFKNNVTSLDANRVNKLSTDFQNKCDSFLTKKGKFYSEFIDVPATQLKDLIAMFTKTTADYWVVYRKLSNRIYNLHISVIEAVDFTIPSLLKPLKDSITYLSTNVSGVTKFDIANDDNVKTKLYDVRQFLDSVPVRTAEIRELWSDFQKGVLMLWLSILDYDEGEVFYTFKGMPTVREYFEQRKRLLGTKIDRVYYTINLQNIIGKTDLQVLDTLQTLFDELDEYSKGHNMDEAFYRRNFLQVDVFFKEMISEQIIQQKAYDAIALLCDIGGATGLFIGGSLLTVFEIVEFLMMFFVCRLCFKKVRPCHRNDA